jgi:hypothetical protein
MKLILISILLGVSLMANAQFSKTANVTAGGLATALTATELNTVTNLTLTGTIDARDFKTMILNMQSLSVLDLTSITIATYSGTEGTKQYYLETDIVDYPANTIPEFAFDALGYSQKWTTIMLPTSITSIGKWAFANCNNITSINIPSQVTEIGDDAFATCTRLSTISIPSSLRTIGYCAFLWCRSLTSVSIPASVKLIGESAFNNCSGIIVVADDNTNYSSKDGLLFNKKQNILIHCPSSKGGSYTIPSTVTSLEDAAFDYCSGLTSITIPESVTSIGAMAFSDCVGLKSINIPSRVRSIDYRTFDNCSALSSITIPSYVTSIDDYAFRSCSKLTSIFCFNTKPVDLSNSAGVFDYTNKTNCKLYVPLGSKVLYSAANQWKDFTNIVEMPEFKLSETSLNLTAQENSQASVELTTNNNWTASCDQNWLELSSTSGSGNNKFIFKAQENTSRTQRTAIVTLVADALYSQRIIITQAGLQTKISTIAGNLSSILSSDELNSISNLSLTGTIDARDFKTMRDAMPYLSDIDLSESTIAAYSGTEGTIGNWQTDYQANSIPKNAFYSTGKENTLLNSIILPSSVITIGDYAFHWCHNLTSINLPLSLKTIGEHSFVSCYNLQSINIPTSVTTMGYSAFPYCTSLSTVNIPSSITSIGSFNFGYCSGLKSVIIPPSITSIGPDAFTNCTNLTTIYANKAAPVELGLSTNVFFNVDKTNCKLYVPYGSSAAYAAANQWKDFTDIVEMPEFKLSSIARSIPAKGDTVSVILTTELPCTASSDQNWLSLNATSGTGNQTFIFTAENNYGFSIRYATVTISTPNLPAQTIIISQGGSPKILEVTPGNLSSLLTASELITFNNIVLTGTIDARDFKTMRDKMTSLTAIDIGATTIVSYLGTEGTEGTYNCVYPANTIPQYAFYNYYTKSKVTSVLLPSSITSIGKYGFRNCTSLTSLVIPPTVNSIGDYAFTDCTNLISIQVPNSIASIGYSTFANCSSLVSVNVPGLISSIPFRTFENCKSLTSISIPPLVTSIDGYSFNGCTGLTSIYVNSSTPIDLKYSTDVFKNVNKTTCKLHVPFGSTPQYAIADKWKDFLVMVEMPEFRLSNNTISVPETNNSVVVSLKTEMSWLVNSNQPWLTVNPVTGTGNQTFDLSSEANPLLAPRTVKIIFKATNDTLQYQILTIKQQGVTKMVAVSAGSLFSSLTEMELNSISNLVVTGAIDARDFKTMRDKMPYLETIDIRNAAILAYTGTEGTDSLNICVYPENAVPQYAFYNRNAYPNNSSLKRIWLPDSVTSIGTCAFQNCSGLESFTMPDAVSFIGRSAFYNCSNLASVNLPLSLTSIENNVFTYCSSLNNVIIPPKVTSLGWASFYACSSLTSIKIPQSVALIDGYAFKNCSALTSIYVTSSSPVYLAYYGVFEGVNKTTCKLYVPFGSGSLYAAVDQWKDFSLRDEMPEFKLSASSGSILAQGGTAIVNLKTGLTWSANSDQAWLTLNTVSGIGDQTFIFTATAHTSSLPRIATVTISAPDLPSQIFTVSQDGVAKILNVTAGNLSTALSEADKNSISNLVLTGTIDARDFKTMRDQMPLLEKIDITNATISAYTGTEGTESAGNIVYPENAVPQYALKAKAKLSSILLPSSITSIGKNSFYQCSGLTSLLIPPLVTFIGQDGFYSCTNLSTINIPQGVISIGSYAFSNCRGLTSVTLPTSINAINFGTFSNCTSLVTMDIPSSVTLIGNSSFEGCTGLTTIKIPVSVTTIDSYAFFGCTSLFSVTIPPSVINIGSNAFYYCTGLRSIYTNKAIPVDLTNSSNVFNYVDKTACKLYVNQESVPLYANADQWKDFINVATLPEFKLSSNQASIQAKGETKTVNLTTGLPWNASSNQSWCTTSATSGTGNLIFEINSEPNQEFISRTATLLFTAPWDVILSQTYVITQEGNPKILNIDAGGLNAALSATEMNNIDHLVLTGTIDARDFKTMRDKMPYLVKIDISGTTIAAYTGTEGTESTNNIVYPSNAIPQNAFYAKIKLTSVLMPSSVTSIRNNSFANCSGLNSVIIPSAVTALGNNCFSSCKGLTSIDIPSNVTSFGSYAFANCSGLASVNLPSSVSSIEYGTFSYCTGLKTINLSTSITNIGTSSFEGCSGLKTINIPASVTTINGYSFYGCTSLTSVAIPPSVNYIGSSSFYNCSGLQTIYTNKLNPVDLKYSTNVFYNVKK